MLTMQVFVAVPVSVRVPVTALSAQPVTVTFLLFKVTAGGKAVLAAACCTSAFTRASSPSSPAASTAQFAYSRDPELGASPYGMRGSEASATARGPTVMRREAN
jgi:hypothetical protein